MNTSPWSRNLASLERLDAQLSRLLWIWLAVGTLAVAVAVVLA